MTRAIFVLTPNESKRLLGKAVVEMDEVKHAFQKSNIVFSLGSTNVYVLEELLGKEKLSVLMNPATYISGIIIQGTLCSSLAMEKPRVVLLKRGVITPPPPTMSEMLHDFKSDSVVIKGANAIDAEGNVGVLVSHPEGGMTGWAIGAILARGICLIVPVGLEKLVPSVRKSVLLCGQERFDYALGKKVGMIPMGNARVVTEIEALKILTGVDAFHVASGGINGSEGSVTLVAEGGHEAMKETIQMIESIKGEPPLNFRKGICETCVDYSPVLPKEAIDYSGSQIFCQFEGKKEEEIPFYLRNR